MIVERDVHTDVRELLMSGRPFQYAHLIKFERPSRPDTLTGAVSTSAFRYTYLTDGSRDVPFDDGSTDNNGVANGSQIYIANKVLKVSSVQEAIEARASNFTVTMDGNGIGAAVTAVVTITAVGDGVHWDIDFPDTVNIAAQGFREGDKVVLTGLSTGSYNIDSFREGNVLRVKKIEDTITTGTGSLTMVLDSEEIKSILMDKLDVNYSSFINREVFIYRAYFENGQMVGQSPDTLGRRGPVLLFKGIISSCDFEETEDDGIKVQWGLTSHWGDFAQVKGRVTSDDFHRALDANGLPQPASTIKPAYAYDLGFIHAETSINLLATYYVKVEKQDVKSKSGFLGLGIGSKVKVKKYFVKEPRHSELDFQLQAKSIPLIYGVRNINGIPIFADTLATDTSQVYIIFVLSEGEIGGIYDIYVNSKSLICSSQADFDTRHLQNSENTIDVICNGRADRGDVLNGTTSVNTGVDVDYYADIQDSYESTFFRVLRRLFHPYTTPPASTIGVATGGPGLTHGKSLNITTPQNITFDFFCGRADQEAASQMVSVSQAKNFKVQQDYWNTPGNQDYWGPNHRLLDTAYVLVKTTIKEGDTTVPDLEFIVRGKSLDCYNYDYSFAHDPKAASESANNFKLGQNVTLYNAATDAAIGVGQIIDKFSFWRPDGVQETRFRWNQVPDLDYDEDGVPAVTRFYMSDGTNRWTMTTFNYEINSGVITTELSTAATVVDDSGNFGVTYPTNPDIIIGSPYYGVITDGNTYGNVLLGDGTATTTTYRSRYSYDGLYNLQ